MNFRIHPSPEAASRSVALEIRRLIESRAREGRMAVLGLATGKTPLGLYRELVRMHRDDGLGFRNVITFNLDEYLGVHPLSRESYWTFMHVNLFDHVDIRPENIHMPPAQISPLEVDRFCADYGNTITGVGGIDHQILGIGRTGHIGFNEPGSGAASRTRLVHLDPITRADAAPDFASADDVPKTAITMGCGTILEAKTISLLAFGQGKAEIVHRALEGEISDQVPASYLQRHPSVEVHLDPGSASFLRNPGRLSAGRSRFTKPESVTRR